ncbi:LacI family DNA-binding transcriptional regulator [Nocardioides bruguierae]|uniref:LacI family DNA-binding transcriptional regulator n=1 Tax=Nocardioides bruguierae TaxID=2945102 RepID=UPI002020DB82|nr:LacI family DNA-binding transcriptional regulator [Nocardioides bruguierae]MCL8026855.1 LacI family transcriptional regulator [Nocardioides bruguierae]
MTGPEAAADEPSPPARTAGGKPPTMAEIAAHLGVSRQLVSAAMRGAPGASKENRERVRQAALELGFVPNLAARELRASKGRQVGVVFNPAHSTEADIIEGVYAEARERGLGVVLSAVTEHRSPRDAFRELIAHRCVAVAVIGSDLPRADLAELAGQVPVPVVGVGYGRRDAAFSVVRSAGDTGIALTVEHLVGLGHTEIAYLDAAGPAPAAIRLAGYRRAVKKHGLVEDVLGDLTHLGLPTYPEEVGSSVARQLLARPSLPTAVVGSNDHAAAALVWALSRRGVRVPEDVSVTGYDDSPLARVSANDLTTVNQRPQDMGRAVVRSSLAAIESPTAPPEPVVVDVELVVRSSTAAPRA